MRLSNDALFAIGLFTFAIGLPLLAFLHAIPLAHGFS
jgi:hypothetical protein